MQTAVIGAGWAGLAAAERLAESMPTVVFEAGRQAGGRARALAAQTDFAVLDNGQHILSGAYGQTLALLRRCGVCEDAAFLRLPCQWRMADGLNFGAKQVAASSIQIGWALLRGQGLALADKMALLHQIAKLVYANPKPQDDVATWLQYNGVSQYLQRVFWQPLVWAAMNTDLYSASLALLRRVLADGMAAGGSESDILLPKQDLARLFVQPVLQRLQRLGATVAYEKRITCIERYGAKWRVDGRLFDAVVLAVAPYHVLDVLPRDVQKRVADYWPEWIYHSITTVYLKYQQEPRLPYPMTGLVEGTAQWLIDRNALGLGRYEISAVISLSEQYGSLAREEWARRVHADVLRLNADLSKPVAAMAVSEKRATATPVDRAHFGLAESILRHENIYLAGDYAHPHYPATLEAAVQSGRTAAERVMYR